MQSALDLQSRIADPAPLARGDLAATYNQLGYLTSSVDTGQAEAAYRHAAEEFERLAADEPHVLRWQAQLAATLNNLAALAVQADRLDDAEADYLRAVEIQRRLSTRAPQVVAYTRDLAVSQNNFGYLLGRKYRPEAAIEQFEAARDNLSRLFRAHDQSPEYASRLGAVCNNLGLAFESQQRNERAQAAFGAAIEWQRKALALSPDSRQARTYLDAHETNLARVNETTSQSSATPSGRLSLQAGQIVVLPKESMPAADRQALPVNAAAGSSRQ